MAKKKATAPSSKTTVRLDDTVHSRAKAVASHFGLKLQAFVSDAVLGKLPELEAKMAADLIRKAGKPTLSKSA